MYESFFQFQQRPFAATPRSDRYFQASDIENACQTLARCIDRAEGPGLLIGGPGTGKSLVCQLLRERFENRYHVVALSDTKLCTRRALLQHILFELGLPYRGMEEGELRLSLIDFLKSATDAGDGMLLLIDEAHTLPLRLIEEIRMITNLVRDGQPRVRLILAGAPSLDERLAHPKLESFSQRIAARCYLQPFSYDETLLYVQSQLLAVGGEPAEIMTDDALHAVYQATDGIPRLINQICDHALLLACASKNRTITARGVEEAWAELQQLPAPWQPPSGFSEPTAGENTGGDDTIEGQPASAGIIEFGALEEDSRPAFDAPAAEDSELASADNAPPAEPVDLTSQVDEIDRQVSEFHEADATPNPRSTGLPSGKSHDFAGEENVALSEQKDGDAFSSMTSQIDVTASHSVIQEKFPAAAKDPFDETFDEEEIVVERYTAAAPAFAVYGPDAREASAARDMIFEGHAPQRPSVPVEVVSEHESGETAPVSGDLADNATDNARESAKSESRARVFRVPPPDDSDIILVLDEPPRKHAADGTARREYRQLFSKLRQGTK